MNIRRIVEIAWLAIAAFSVVEFYIEYSANKFSQKAIMFLLAVVVAFFMYSLRKRSRKKIEEYNNSNKEL
jgi:hypothetical protein